MNKIPNNIDSPLIKIYIYIYIFSYTTSLKKKKKKKINPYTKKEKEKRRSQLIGTKHHKLLELRIESISRLHIKAKI